MSRGLLALLVITGAAAIGHARGVPTAATIEAKATRALGPLPAGGVTVILREVSRVAASQPRATRRKATPSWVWRIARSPGGDIRIDREDLTRGSVSTESFPAAQSIARAPTWVRLLLGDGKGLAEVAKQLGVTKRTSLARDGREIVWVWGAEPRDRRSAQLHVVRSSGRLRRVIDAAEDVTLRGVAQPASAWGRRFPATVEIRRQKTSIHFAVRAVTPVPLKPSRAP